VPLPPWTLNQRRVFDSEMLAIRHVVVHATTAACGPFEEAAVEQLVLPLSGVFARHDGPHRYSIANANHALFFDRNALYRVSCPGCIGDEVLVLEFAPGTLNEVLGEIGAEYGGHAFGLLTHTLIPPAAALERNMLWRYLRRGAVQALGVEETAVRLLAAALHAASRAGRRSGSSGIRDSFARRKRQVEAVKEALSVCPQRGWTLSEVAHVAHSSPCHLSRVFTSEVGVPIHQYLLRMRLARGLAAIVDGERDLTDVALDAGFASHSHFTSSFRKFFGMTPSAVRQTSGLPGALLASL
jgi:AraC family transcriptional regulator